MTGNGLYWLPHQQDWAARLKDLKDDASSWPALVQLAGAPLDFLQTNKIDRNLTRLFAAAPPGLATKPIRLAVLASSTVDHLVPGVRVGALRRGLHVTTFLGDYGQYLQALNDTSSALHAFRPNAILLSFDATSLLGGLDGVRDAAGAAALLETALERLRGVWRLATQLCGGQVIQQSVLPVPPRLMGANEHRLPSAPAALVRTLNERIRAAADAANVDVLDLDTRVADDGVRAWHDPVLWHRAKQEITPNAAPIYGDLVARLLAAQQGRSAKCLVLDLDNTLWGGVIGDDGIEGIVLGQGSALGEAYVAFQRYAKALSQRGVILAVCSKNDEANALAPFEKHPDMVLRRSDIACFVANWQDKPANLRHVAQQLNIGIDSLVFADDNPFERNIVRRELPMVGVPELPEDPALYARCIADGGYFEALRITGEDLERAQQYQGNLQREALKSSATDLPSYLKSLNMKLAWKRFDPVGLPRIVQLINKTNQFNLTTRRYTDAEVRAVMDDPAALSLQLRLTDQFGDNGIIAIVIGKPKANGRQEMLIDTWLMSCRVLGRQVEEATLNLVAAEAKRLGAATLVGEYRPTAKNGMVREHYAKLGFAPLSNDPDGATQWRRDLTEFKPYDTFIDIVEG